MAWPESHVFSRGQAARRILVSILLGVAMTQFVLGITVLEGRFSPGIFFLYWGSCFLLVMTVLALAVHDLREIRAEARRENRDLVRRHFLDDDFLERIREATEPEDAERGPSPPRPPSPPPSGPSRARQKENP